MQKFTIVFGFATSNGQFCGETTPMDMPFDSLALSLTMIDPFLRNDWIGKVRLLRRRGDKTIINITSSHKRFGQVLRLIKITRK